MGLRLGKHFLKLIEAESDEMSNEVIDLNVSFVSESPSEYFPFEKGTSNEEKRINVLFRYIDSALTKELLPKVTVLS